MGSLDKKQHARLRRKKRIRKKICGTSERPRLCVYRSARHIYAQIIDDGAGQTLVTASSLESGVSPPDVDAAAVKKKVQLAAGVGKLVGQRAIDKGIRRVVFDRNGFLYHGRVKAVSEGAREAGLDF